MSGDRTILRKPGIVGSKQILSWSFDSTLIETCIGPAPMDRFNVLLGLSEDVQFERKSACSMSHIPRLYGELESIS
jgi:hypothetical protein